MSALEQAKRFFEACEASAGWEGCREFVAPNAGFVAQSEPFHATHTGEGGPVPPTHRETNTDSVYVLKMDASDKVSHMTKVWNAPWAMRELGWL